MAASEATPRVALLARAGEACERIAQALRDAGAELVLVADPMQAGSDEVRRAQPQAVLVALEPAIEDAIERYEDVLADPAYMVIFEEAEQAAQRSGWDAARWLRHLSAKLHRHDDVLPAGAEPPDEVQLTAEPMPAQSPRVDFDDAIVALTDEAQDRADDVPPDGLEGLHGAAPQGLPTDLELEPLAAPELSAPAADATAGAGEAPVALVPEPALDDNAAIEWGGTPLDLVPDGAAGALEAPAVSDIPVEADSDMPTLSLDDAGDGLDALAFDPERFSRAGQAEGEAGGIEEFLAAQIARTPDAVQADAAVEAQQAGAAVDADPAPSVTGPRVDFSSLSLVEDDHVPATRAAPAKSAPTFDLESLGAGLSLVDPDSYGHGKRPGLVLIEAGLGGPDAVRQLLAALPAGFSKPILIRLALEGGRYDRLVKQMTRATTAPVEVAESGARAAEGSIYFVPPGLGIRPAGAGWAFEAGETLDPASLPADDSAVVFLSGADVALVPPVAGGQWAGLVLGQTPDDGCYDPAAARAASEAGASPGSPGELAGQLLARWPATGGNPHTDPDGTP